jgi:hypothetical protein
MNEFVYLYRRGVASPASPQQMQERMNRWRAWFTDLEKQGHLAFVGHPLSDGQGALVRDAAGKFNDGPYAETKDLVVGYTVVRAADLGAAIALTKGHPIFDQGGMIEVRPVVRLS